MSKLGYVWFDSEFSSLELESAVLLQVAALATDEMLRPVGEGEPFEVAIRLDADERVSPWVCEHLGELVDRCRGEEAVALAAADEALLAWLKRQFGVPHEQVQQRPILAGNSVHNDWLMVRRHLPRFHGGLHYRLLDVSSFKSVWQAWGDGAAFDKEQLDMLNAYFPGGEIACLRAHDALFDIQASIAELAYYKEKLGFS
tara:strand:+ start:798 stop:1397 length:600 start_codon:yes stop_codon:yes gene_type:complete